VIAELQSWWISKNLPNSCKKTELPEKFTLTEKRVPAHWPTPIYKLSMMSVVWNIPLASLHLLPGCAPSQFLYTCSLAIHGKLEKVLDFLTTAKNISVLSTFFLY